MLRSLLMVSSVAALSAALCAPVMASEISGDVSLSGGIDYTVNPNNGTLNFLSESAASPQFAPAAPQLAGGPAAGTASLMGDFSYNGNLLSSAVFLTTIGGQTGTLTLNTITQTNYLPNGIQILLSGTFDQSGYAQEAATASFLIDSEYVGNDVNLMMFQGIAQLTPPPLPEPRSLALMGTGILALAGAGLMRRRLTAHDARGVDVA